MVEVYSTDVKSEKQERFILKVLQTKFPDYKINFDLEDRDNILRVEKYNSSIDIHGIIEVIKDFGYTAEVLPDVTNIPNNAGELEENKCQNA